MRIVADENIPYVREAFAQFGEIHPMAGREIRAAHVRDADLLLVRSVTPITAELLDGSRVRFIGSATIGVDHVDLPYLNHRHIEFAYAPGSNANAVAEYVIAALLALPMKPLSGRRLGIIGLGRIGALVKRKAEALGLRVLANDPPLARAGHTGLIALDELLPQCDVITTHVPLTLEGPDATRHLLDAARLGLMKADAVVINTARGGVVESTALLDMLTKRRLAGAVLDVWEGEPAPDPALIDAVTIGTPHVAGYSVDGKISGTQMLYEAACVHLHQPQIWRPPLLRGGAVNVTMDPCRAIEDIIGSLVTQAYDIRRDDRALRAIAHLQSQERGATFDRLRATYPARMEFKNTSVVVPKVHVTMTRILSAIGFTVRLV